MGFGCCCLHLPKSAPFRDSTCSQGSKTIKNGVPIYSTQNILGPSRSSLSHRSTIHFWTDDDRCIKLLSHPELQVPAMWSRQAISNPKSENMVPVCHESTWTSCDSQRVWNSFRIFFEQVWDFFLDFLAGTICLVFATVWTLNLSCCMVFATFGQPSILHEISCMWTCSPSILYGICHILACSPSILHGICMDLLYVGVFPFHFAWDWPHLGMFTFHFAWDFLHVGVFTFHFAWHGIGCILACSPSILHGICYMWTCSPSILYGICYMLACSPSILHGVFYMWACSLHHHANPKGFDTFWHGHLHYIIMSPPSCQEKVSSQKCKLRTMVMVRIHTIMFTTSSCQPQLMYLRAWVLI